MQMNLTIDVLALGLTLDANIVFTPGIPATTWGPSDRWHEGEAAIVDIVTLQYEGNNAYFLLDSKYGDLIHDLLLDKAQDAYDQIAWVKTRERPDE